MRPEIQALLGNNGGVPVAADEADITDEKSKELIANFNTLTGQDGLAFYPDWPTPTFYDELNAGLQELVNGTQVARRRAAAARRAVPVRRRRHRRLTRRMPRARVVRASPRHPSDRKDPPWPSSPTRGHSRCATLQRAGARRPAALRRA